MTSTQAPTLHEAIRHLEKISGARDVHPGTLLIDAEVDSINFFDWLAAMGMESVQIDDSVLYEMLEDGTVNDLYDAVLAAAQEQ